MGLFSSKPTTYLGVDIGGSSIKMVELKKEGGGLKLLSYGFSENLNFSSKVDWQKDLKYTAAVINKVREKSGIHTNSAIAALPTFSVFSSVLNLSNVDPKDISSAVQWEAKKVIPLPLEEMVLDWRKIETEKNNKKSKNVKVLLTGAPKTLVQKYVAIFKEAKINLTSLETETFSLVRSLLGNDKTTTMIAEIGATTTDISIINKSVPILNRSIDVGGTTITETISKNLNIGLERAEQFKYDMGINLIDKKDDIVPQSILDSISPIINEIRHVVSLYEQKNNNKIEKIVLSGGASMLPSLSEYLSRTLNINVIIGDPWSRISCPVDLEAVLKEVGPRLSVAIGLAMRGIE